jgi:hypothetical protein
MTTLDEKSIARDRMRYIQNTQSANLCYLGILFNVLFFVNIYKSDVGTYYYNVLIGVSIVNNLLFLLACGIIHHIIGCGTISSNSDTFLV